ncbi:MAG: MFS transporter [Actinobacteria bacterium]|nr:MFS transporter [Actinomycetota bacterium]
MAARPGSMELRSPAGRWVLIAAILGSGIVFLDSTVVNVALPQIGRELPVTFMGVLEAQAYVYYAYLLTLSALLILAGALADHYGRKKMFVIGLVGFGVTSVLCGAAPSMELLVLFRILQGAAGAILVPGSLAVLTSTFEGEDQGRAFGLWAGGSAATTILGPALGGALVAYSWRAAFFINVPLIAIALLAARHMPESRDEEAHGRFDWVGAAVVAVAVGGLTFGAIRGQSTEWEDPVAFVAIAFGALATVALPFYMGRKKDPLIPLGLFRSRNFTVTNISTLVIYGALYVTFQYLALFAIGTLGYSELAFGLAGIPGSLFLVFLSSRMGAVAVRYGPRWFMTIGPVVMGLGLLWFVRLPFDSEPWRASLGDLSSLVPPRDYFVDLLPALIVFGIGIAIMVAPLTTALMRSVPSHNSGLASAINNAISRVGPQLFGAIIFVTISATFYANFDDAMLERRQRPTTQVGVGFNVRERISPLNRPDPELGRDVVGAAAEASTDALRLAMLVGATLCFAGAVVNGLGIRNDQLHAEHETGASEPVTQPA